jgi:hypothetical protein
MVATVRVVCTSITGTCSIRRNDPVSPGIVHLREIIFKKANVRENRKIRKDKGRVKYIQGGEWDLLLGQCHFYAS